MMTNQQLKVGQVWKYQYADRMSGEMHEPMLIFITKFVNKKWVQFQYLDNWDADEMSYSIFYKYCELVSG
jgi:hypothetical protein